jgi:putative membrane protein
MIALYWPSLTVALLAAHALANVLWIGGLLAETVIQSRGSWVSDPSEMGALARRLHTRLALPGFLGSLAAGLAVFLPARRAYAHMPWMYAKLAFALVVIVLHFVIGARARRMAAGSVEAGRGVWTLGWLAFLAAGGAILFSIARSTP